MTHPQLGSTLSRTNPAVVTASLWPIGDVEVLAAAVHGETTNNTGGRDIDSYKSPQMCQFLVGLGIVIAIFVQDGRTSINPFYDVLPCPVAEKIPYEN